MDGHRAASVAGINSAWPANGNMTGTPSPPDAIVTAAWALLAQAWPAELPLAVRLPAEPAPAVRLRVVRLPVVRLLAVRPPAERLPVPPRWAQLRRPEALPRPGESQAWLARLPGPPLPAASRPLWPAQAQLPPSAAVPVDPTWC